MVKAVVKVYARLRPVRPRHTPAYRVIEDDSTGEEPTARGLEFNVPRKEGDVVNNSRDKFTFAFDRVFDAGTSQDAVFDAAAHGVVMGALEGYNGTVFAYGQTGSGKTFTITGGEKYRDRGITPRTFTTMFEEFDKRPDTQWNCFISYLEIYNENIYDLLDRSNQDKPIEEWNKIALRDDSDGDLHLKDLLVYEAKTEQEALNLLFLGNVNRMTSETPMNQASSRSHCIFTITIESRRPGSETVRSSKIHLVDLAGSERVYKTSSGELTRREGRYINLSLHYLEQVILALHDKAKGRSVHIPYRNSLMTSVLRDSLGGNSRTVFVATLNAESEFTEESLSTCRFAQRCSMISHDIIVNESTDPLLVIQRLKKENAALKAQIASGAGAPPPAPVLDPHRELTTAEVAECEAKVVAYLKDKTPAAGAGAGAGASGDGGSDDGPDAALRQPRLDVDDLGKALVCAALLKVAVQGAADQMQAAMDHAARAEARADGLQEALGRQTQAVERLEAMLEEVSAERATWKELATAKQSLQDDRSELERQRLEDRLQRERVEWEKERAQAKEEAAEEAAEAERERERGWYRERKDKESDADDGVLPRLAADLEVQSRASSVGIAATPRAEHFMQLLTRGGVFLKHGRWGSPHPRFVWVSPDGSTVSWRAVGTQKVSNSILARSVFRITPGCQSSVFSRGKGRPARDNACFSLYTPGRTLDLEVELLGSPSFAGVKPEEQASRDEWVSAFRQLVTAVRGTPPLGVDAGGSGLEGSALDGVGVAPADSPSHFSVSSTPMLRTGRGGGGGGGGGGGSGGGSLLHTAHSAPRLPRHPHAGGRRLRHVDVGGGGGRSANAGPPAPIPMRPPYTGSGGAAAPLSAPPSSRSSSVVSSASVDVDSIPTTTVVSAFPRDDEFGDRRRGRGRDGHARLGELDHEADGGAVAY